MRALSALMLLLVAGAALATEFVPLQGGVTWTYEGRDPMTGTRLHGMSGPTMYHGLVGYRRVEVENGVMLATTYWVHDDQGRVLLLGVDWGSAAAGGTWFFDPAPVFVAPDLPPDETLTTTAGLWEATDAGAQWYGEHQVSVTCHDLITVNLPDFGSMTATKQSVSWPDSPHPAPWNYGRNEVRTYARWVGLCTIASTVNPGVIWDLAQVEGLETTEAPDAGLATALVAAPTPFNPTTVFKLRLAAAGPVRLEVFDIRGRQVDVVHTGPLAAGLHAIPWQPRDLASGTYLARLSSGRQVATTRVTLLE